jgi:hypothetical protein
MNAAFGEALFTPVTSLQADRDRLPTVFSSNTGTVVALEKACIGITVCRMFTVSNGNHSPKAGTLVKIKFVLSSRYSNASFEDVQNMV